MASLLNAVMGSPPPVPATALRIHRIATPEEQAEDDEGSHRCGSCAVVKPESDYYHKPDGRRYAICKACHGKRRARKAKP